MNNRRWISFLTNLCLLHFGLSQRCYMIGNRLNVREYTLRVGARVQKVLCEGKTIFRPETCSCFLPMDGCDKRPLGHDGSGFEQLDLGGVWKSFTCPHGTMFIREVCRCDFGTHIPRVRNYADCYIEPASRKTTYELVINNVSTLQKCPAGEMYEPGSCACIPIDPTCDKKEDPTAINKFQQRVTAEHWETLYCAPGTVFNTAKCRCDY